MVDFQFFLNRQGPRGPQGYKGDKGNDGSTPVPRTGTNTPIETTVIFDTGDGNPYETPNLKYPIEDRGGDIVMLDRTNETQYYGTPDHATDNSYGIVKLATPESVLNDPLDNDVVTYKLFDNNNQTIKATTDGLAGDITQLNTDLGDEVTNRNNADIQLNNKINTDVGNEAMARSNADTALSGRIDGLETSKANKSEVYTKTQTDSLLNNKSNVGHTHNYNELTNKPDIGNGTITFKQGNITVGAITANQLTNSTITFADPTGVVPGAGLNLDSSTNTLSVKIDNDTLGINSNGELEVQDVGTTYAAGNGINISNDVISAKVDNDTINFDSSGNLVANIPDVSNFVTNSSLATTLQSYPTNIQLTNTLKNYPTKTAQQNIINYDLASWDDFTYGDKVLSYAKFPIIGSDECPFYYVEPTGDITATSTGFRFNNNCVEFFLDTYEITPFHQVCFKAKQGDRIVITSANNNPIIRRYNGDTYIPDYDHDIDDGHTCISDDYFSATMDWLDPDAGPWGDEINYQIEVLQDCLISRIETRKTPATNPEGTYSFEYIMANNNPAIEFVIPMVLDGHIKAIFNPDVAGGGLKINSVNKDRIEVDVDNTTIGINETGQLTYIGTTGDVLPSQTGNAGKFLTTDGSVTSWATVSQPDMAQYYTKTQTDSLLDGKISNNIVQHPLEYLPDTTSSIKMQNFNGPLAFSGENGYFSISSQPNSYFYLKDGNGNYVDIFTNLNAVNFDNLGWVEAELTNGLNITSKAFSYKDGAFRYGYILGHYNNNVFIPDVVIRGAEDFSESIEIISTRGYYSTSTSGYYSPIYVAVYKPVGSTTLYIASKYKNFTGTLTSEEAAILDNVTHIRVLPMCSMSGQTYTTYINSIKVVNPNPNTTIVTSGNDAERLATYNSGTSIFDAHPASLSLKYDSNTLGVNANNELYALSSAPTNMVTTDTSQTITGQKTFDTDSLKTKNILFNESGYSYGLRIDSGNLRYGQSSGDYSYLSPGGMGTHNDYSNHSLSTNGWWMGTGYNTAFMQRAGISGSGYSYLANNQARKFYNPSYSNATNSFTPDSSTPFFMTSDLLDGTTITYNSSTNKISAVNPVQSTTIHNIVKLTQSEYDTLVNNNNVDSNTFYIITST